MSLKAAAGPVVGISLYAPVQKGSPARIVGLTYKSPHGHRAFLQFLIQNVSSKPVVGVEVESRAAPPPGCPGWRSETYSGPITVHFQIHLLPKDRKTILHDTPSHGVRSGFGPELFALAAKNWQAAYMEVQFRVDEVDFEDGSKWDVSGRFEPGRPAFDSTLAATDSKKCTDADRTTATTHALTMIEEWRFMTQGEEKDSLHGGDDADPSDVPQVHFSCELQDRLAVCSSSP